MVTAKGFSRRDWLATAAMASAWPAAAATSEYLIYWGTYTAGGERYGTGESKGIYVSRFHSESGKTSLPELAIEAANPSYLAVHPNGRFLYSVNEHIDQTGKTMGEVSAFAIDRRTGKLKNLSLVSSRGGMPCHIVADHTGRTLAVANWATGSVATFPIRGNGTIGESTGFYQHAGERSGAAPGSSRPQTRCHAVAISRDSRFLISTDTGLNKAFVQRLDSTRATFAPNEPPFHGFKNPVNPRHLLFHPNGGWAYVANEAGAGCTMLRYDAASGVFEEGPMAPTAPKDATGRVSPSEAVLHPSGKFVLVSNRGHESIAVLRIDPSNGALEFVEAFQPGGAGPRSFNVDPTGKWVFALMQRSNIIVPLRFDEAGKLSAAGDKINLPVPVCAKFVALD